MNKKQQGRGESYLERWRLLAAVEAGGVVFAPFLLLFLCFFAMLFFLFLLSSSVSLLGATGGCGEEEQRWRCRAEGGRRWFFFFPPSTPPLVFFLSVLFCFSSLLSGLCFLFLSPFSRLASLSVTALLSFFKILSLSFPPSYYVLPRLYL